MQLRNVIASLFVASAAAQTTTGNSTDLPSLVAQLPTCALSCFAQAASDISCSASDFNCLCSKSQDLISKIGPCLLLGSGCSDQDFKKVSALAPQICAAVNTNANPSAVASASNIVNSALASASVTRTSASATSSPTNAAARPEMAYGLMGAAALAAIAI